MVMIDPTTRRLVHCTRAYIRNVHPTRRHPYLGIPLPRPIRHRLPPAQQEGHSGAIAFGYADITDLPDVPDDGFSLGEALHPGEVPPTHVRTVAAGSVWFLTRADARMPEEEMERRERRRKTKRVGCERRRRVWREGKPAGRGGEGKKVGGAKRARDERGRWI